MAMSMGHFNVMMKAKSSVGDRRCFATGCPEFIMASITQRLGSSESQTTETGLHSETTTLLHCRLSNHTSTQALAQYVFQLQQRE